MLLQQGSSLLSPLPQVAYHQKYIATNNTHYFYTEIREKHYAYMCNNVKCYAHDEMGDKDTHMRKKVFPIHITFTDT